MIVNVRSQRLPLFPFVADPLAPGANRQHTAQHPHPPLRGVQLLSQPADEQA